LPHVDDPKPAQDKNRTAAETESPRVAVAGDNALVGPLAQWLKQYRLDDYPVKVYQDGVQALIDTVNQ
jgi:hypothetical protein